MRWFDSTTSATVNQLDYIFICLDGVMDSTKHYGCFSEGSNPSRGTKGSLAQLIEQLTLNQWVASLSLAGTTKKKICKFGTIFVYLHKDLKN